MSKRRRRRHGSRPRPGRCSKDWCGPAKLRWLARLVPDGCWGAACRRHDWAYGRGGGWRERLAADCRLFVDIVACGLRAEPTIRSLFKHLWVALVYFVAVRAFGAACFNWRRRPR